MPSYNVTLKAEGEIPAPEEYAISYNLDGGSLPAGKSNPKTYNSQTGTFTLNNPVRNGYEFTGWTGTGLNTQAQTVTVKKGSTGNRSYTAHWKKKAPTTAAYTIKHYLQNADGTYSYRESTTGNAAIGNTIADMRKKYDGYTQPAVKSVKISSKASDNIIEYRYPRKTYKINISGDKGISAVRHYSVTDSKTKDSYRWGESVRINADVKNGYTWSKWTGVSNVKNKKYDFTMPQSDVNRKATTTINSYKVTYKDVSGSINGKVLGTTTVNKNYGTKVSGSDMGSDTAVGRYYTGYEYSSSTTATVTGNVTVYRIFKAHGYAISYNLDGGSLPAGKSNPKTYTIESDTITLNNPVRNGYEFTGWTGTGLNTETMTITIPKGSTGDRAYTAHWKKQVKIICIDRVVNSSGKVIRELGVYGSKICNPGDAVSGSDFGTEQDYDDENGTYEYAGCTDITVTSADELKVYRNFYCWHDVEIDKGTGIEDSFIDDEKKTSSKAKEGDTVSVKATSENGYNNDSIKWSGTYDSNDNPYSFVVPDRHVYLKVSAVENEYTIKYKSNIVHSTGNVIDRESLQNVKYNASVRYKTAMECNSDWAASLEDVNENRNVSTSPRRVYELTAGSVYYFDDGTEKIPYKFVGWSISDSATVNGSDSIYGSAETIGFDSLINDCVNAGNDIRHNNGSIELYAVWDKFPEQEEEKTAVFFSDDLKDKAERQAYNELAEGIFGKVNPLLKDREDGYMNGPSSQIELVDIEYVLNELSKFKNTGSITTRARVTDNAGNTTRVLITITNQSRGGLVEETTMREVKPYVRSINEYYYRAPERYADYSEENYRYYGGLSPYSIWYVRPSYREAIERAFANLNNDTPEQEWLFRHEDVIKVHRFVGVHEDPAFFIGYWVDGSNHGFGKFKEKDALMKFYDEFEYCRIK